MAKKKHLEIIKRGVDVWNKWREDHPQIRPDISNADLTGVNLSGANFSHAYMRHKNGSEVRRTAWLKNTNFTKADLSDADFYGANLCDANFTHADLNYTKFTYTSLERTNFSNADLTSAIFDHAYLIDADLSEAIVGYTIFAGCIFERVKGLDKVHHVGPSSIGLDTLYQSRPEMPENFLRRAGVPEPLVTYLSSLTKKAIEFYSCFISYSSRDQEFAQRLYTDLQSRGVRCWFASEDLKIGERIRVGIDESIRIHDKLLLILSEHSVESDWVEKEVETALEQERQQKQAILFPIRLDDAVMIVENGWPADVRRTRNIGDFRGWKHHDMYLKALERLMRDLSAEYPQGTRLTSHST